MSAGSNDLRLDREPDLARLVAELETTVEELGRETFELDQEWYLARFAELYDGGIEAFGLVGPDVRERLEAHLWFLLDCPLPAGQTPLWRMRQRTAGRAVELLARSELRAWRIESIGAARSLGALCPIGGGRARLDAARTPLGDLRPGALVVARSVPLGPQRWALLGGAPVLEASVTADFEELLGSLDAPRGELWRVHGGVLARAAWAWPEHRERTIDGERVQWALLTCELSDVDGAYVALASDPELEPVETEPIDSSDVTRWRWRWDPPSPRSQEVEPGVRYSLCDQDTGPQPTLATVDIDRRYRDAWLLAPTPARLALAERLLRDRLGRRLGRISSHQVEQATTTPRWKRLLPERELEEISAAIRRARRRAA